MSDPTVNSPAAPRKRRVWLRILALLSGLVVVVLFAAYFIGTSAGFLKSVILPKVSKAINAEVTVSDASISPFSQVVLRNLKVQPAGKDPLVTAPEVRLRYSLTDIIRGNIHVDEVSLSSPTVTLVQYPDGTSNLDPLLQPEQGKTGPEQKKPSEPKSESKPPQVDIRKVVLSDGTLRQVQRDERGVRRLVEITKLNVSVQNIANGQTGSATLAGAVNFEDHPPGATNALLQAKMDGNFSIGLSQDLKPSGTKGSAVLRIERAEGAIAQAAMLTADLQAEATPTEIKQVSLRFQRGAALLGQMLVSGPFSLEKTEGKLSINLLSVDRQLLDIIGAPQGIRFGTTTLRSTNQVELGNSGKVVSAVGRVDIEKLQVIRTNQTTPQLDLGLSYDTIVDLSQSNRMDVLLRALSLAGTQNGARFLEGTLTAPMLISKGGTNSALGDAAFNLAILGFDLANWKVFTGAILPEGRINAQFKLLARGGTDQLGFDLNTSMENLTALVDTNRITEANINLQATGTVSNLRQVQLSKSRLLVARQGQDLASAEGSGTYDLDTKAADLQLDARAMLARLAGVVSVPELRIGSGTIALKTGFRQQGDIQSINGTLNLADFTAQFGSNDFRSFGANMDLTTDVTTNEIFVRKLNGSLSEGGRPGGMFSVSGAFHRTNKSARIMVGITNFNQNGLRPFLEPALGGKKLVAVSLNGTADAERAPNGASKVKADLTVSDLRVSDPSGLFPTNALSASTRLDAALSNQVVTVSQCRLGLSPTALAANNAVQLAGRIDMSGTNAAGKPVYQGNVALTADAFDVTPYYDLFMDNKAVEPAASGKPQDKARPGRAAAPSTGVETEPSPLELPFRVFTAEARIGAFYLREIQISNLVATAKFDASKVTVEPLQLRLNGAPITSSLTADLGVTGFVYNVKFDARGIPLSPLMNSFQPDRKGQVQGTLTGNANVGGRGITGANLKKHLAAQFDIGSTNLNLRVESLRSPLARTLINVIAVVPTIIANPNSALTTLGSALFGSKPAETQGGWVDELRNSPIDVIQANGSVTNGLVTLERTFVQSPAFQANAPGTVRLEDVLTNSVLNIALKVAVRRGLAEKIGMVPPGTPTNAVFVNLPDYVTIQGTVGAPKEKLNKVALLGTAAQAIGRSVPGLDQKTGGLLQGLGTALTGQRQSSTNAAPTATTNAPTAGTNAPRNNPGGLLQGLGGLLGGAGATNSAVSTNAPATNAPAQNLLDQLLGPKKK
jgi:hypothetical protein